MHSTSDDPLPKTTQVLRRDLTARGSAMQYLNDWGPSDTGKTLKSATISHAPLAGSMNPLAF